MYYGLIFCRINRHTELKHERHSKVMLLTRITIKTEINEEVIGYFKMTARLIVF